MFKKKVLRLNAKILISLFCRIGFNKERSKRISHPLKFKFIFLNKLKKNILSN